MQPRYEMVKREAERYGVMPVGRKKSAVHSIGFVWHQSDDFASHRHHAVALRFALHHFINAVASGFCSKSVRLIDTCARLRAFNSTPRTSHTAARPTKTGSPSQSVRNADIRRIQIDVVGHQELARAHHCHSRRGCSFGSPTSAAGHDFSSVFAQPFELPSPHVFQVHAVRRVAAAS